MKPTRGFEPRTPSLRGRRGVCGWLRSVALTDQDKPISDVSPPDDLRLVQGAVLPPCCHPRGVWALITSRSVGAGDFRARLPACTPRLRDMCHFGAQRTCMTFAASAFTHECDPAYRAGWASTPLRGTCSGRRSRPAARANVDRQRHPDRIGRAGTLPLWG